MTPYALVDVTARDLSTTFSYHASISGKAAECHEKRYKKYDLEKRNKKSRMQKTLSFIVLEH